MTVMLMPLIRFDLYIQPKNQLYKHYLRDHSSSLVFLKYGCN